MVNKLSASGKINIGGIEISFSNIPNEAVALSIPELRAIKDELLKKLEEVNREIDRRV